MKTFKAQPIHVKKFMKDDVDDKLIALEVPRDSYGIIRTREFNGKLTFYEDLVQLCYDGQVIVFDISDIKS